MIVLFFLCAYAGFLRMFLSLKLLMMLLEQRSSQGVFAAEFDLLDYMEILINVNNVHVLDKLCVGS